MSDGTISRLPGLASPRPDPFFQADGEQILGVAWTSMSFPSPKHREVNQPKKDGIFTKSMVYTD